MSKCPEFWPVEALNALAMTPNGMPASFQIKALQDHLRALDSVKDPRTEMERLRRALNLARHDEVFECPRCHWFGPDKECLVYTDGGEYPSESEFGCCPVCPKNADGYSPEVKSVDRTVFIAKVLNFIPAPPPDPGPCFMCLHPYGKHREVDLQCPTLFDKNGWNHGWLTTRYVGRPAPL